MNIDDFLRNLPPETLRQCAEAINSYKRQYSEMIAGSNQSKIDATMNVYETIDELVQDDLKTGQISCKEGCNHCCHLCVYISPDEAFTILNYCHDNEIEIDWDRVENQKELNSNNWVKEPTTISRCIFLQNGSCSIYPVRPMACRKYHVITEPALCDTTTGAHRVGILNNFDVELLVSSIHQLRTFSTLPQELLKQK